MMLYDKISDALLNKYHLDEMLKSFIDDSCYQDNNLKTLTIDFGFYISKEFNIEDKEWLDNCYPEVSVDTWVKLLEDESIFTKENLTIFKRFLDNGSETSCKQLAKKYGLTPAYYNSKCRLIAQKVIKKLGFKPIINGNSKQYWPLLFYGRYAKKSEIGGFIWKLRDEIVEALESIDLSNIQLYENGNTLIDDGIESKSDIKSYPIKDYSDCNNFWFLVAKPQMWKFSEFEVDEEQYYTLYNNKGNKRNVFKNFLEAKVGEPLIVYESSPTRKVVGLMEVVREQDGKSIYFKKIKDFKKCVTHSEFTNDEVFIDRSDLKSAQGSLFKLNKTEFLRFLFLSNDKVDTNEVKECSFDPYIKQDFLEKVYMSEQQYDKIAAVLKRKKNIILQGAPGVGKTFTAKRLAYSLMGCKDSSRIEFIQFHQNYCYEDFVLGYKPTGDSFELKEGIFYNFCKKAEDNPDKDYYFIIDEINRGNLSKIFGELLMMIETDYRGESVTLAYNSITFTVPKNLYIIGMMNTADRSLSLIDYALRRRFSFIDIEPGFNSVGFINYKNSLSNEIFNCLIDKIIDLNKEIEKDPSLGKGFCIGHSYFCNQTICTDSWMKEIIEFEILPMLKEYWFDDIDKYQKWENYLNGIFNESK